MISKAFCAIAGIAISSETASRIKAPRFIFLPERAKLHSVYAPLIMGHKLLFTCAFLALLAPAAARASTDATQDYRKAAALEALSVVGVRYHYGGNSPDTGFDCSGLVTHVFDRAWGIAVPRSTEEQRNAGRAVKRKDLQPGDLVFYNTRNRPFSHVGIYLGDSNFVHAPRPGQRVRVESIDTKYWRTRFSGARRLDPPAY
jgi:cell wall-associated NlpC family hydrolase